MSEKRAPTPIDIIHLSDIQIGARCRFPTERAAADLRRAVTDDIRRLTEQKYLNPKTNRLLAVTGDIADAARPDEYEQARQLLVGLAEDLDIPLTRVLVVPGNHDVSWLKCRHYFEECAELGSTPALPYSPKLVFWERFFAELYQDLPETTRPRFETRQPWTISTFADLGLQVLGLNSCWKERHGEKENHGEKVEHVGWVDLDSLRTMLDTARVKPQPLAIALVHHNPLADQVKPTASLHNGRQVLELLDEHGVRLLLCGHGHLADAVEQRNPYGGTGITVLAAGSLSVTQDERPESTRNQYQIVQLGPQPRVLRRAYNPHLADGRFDADPINNEWCWNLKLWQEPGGTTPPPSVAALITSYREHCRRSYQDLVGSLYRRQNQVANPLICQVYVPLKVEAPTPPDLDKQEDRQVKLYPPQAITLDGYLQQTGSQPLLLTGGAGSGKTTFLRYRLGCWVEAAPDNRLLLYVPLARLSDHLAGAGDGANSLWRALAAFLAEEAAVAFTAEQLAGLGNEGRCELLLDGLDELVSKQRPRLVQAVRSALARADGSLRLIISSRPWAAADAGSLPGLVSRAILDLDDDQRSLFLRRYHERLFEPIPERAAQECARLMSAMAAHPTLYQLGRTPLMLLGLAVVSYREGRLPHGRDEVFKALTDAVLELRFPGEKERKRQARRLQTIALAMHERGERDLPLPAFEVMVGEVLESEFGSAPCVNDLDACCDQLLGVTGLLEADEHRARFVHLGFQEYLAARALANQLQGRFSAEQVADHYLDDGWWREAMSMLVSLLSRDERGYEGPRLWQSIFDRRRQGSAPVARLAQLAESLLEIEPQRREGLANEEAQLVQEIVTLIEDPRQPGSLDDRIAAAEALGQLGDPRCSTLPPAMVEITPDLAIATYPITVAQYQQFVDAGGYRPEVFGEQRYTAWQTGIDLLLADEDFNPLWESIQRTRNRSAPDGWASQLIATNWPVVGVSYFEAEAFCAWLTANSATLEYRLPTRGEWQLAAGGKAGNKQYPWGTENPGKGADARANCGGLGLENKRPTPVGLFPLGAANWNNTGKLHDMAGNVWEWCSNLLSEEGEPTIGGLFRPLCGGCFWRDSEYLVVSCRFRYLAAFWYDDVGFRVVRCARRPPALDH